ncbi:Gfo/Idh/MocA family protein [Natrinema amylolyticum]|uniref:Gfo/Idh/MocA family protein n=1 Tax=Natrinema amylolyticum TaxID=2878679 RepID=UPI001CF98DDB|nr:Gfo/Idh/MocA family oxidoreductase [Natrinema amylolyticum]
MTYRAGIIGTGGIAGMGILGMHDEEVIGTEKIEASHAGGYDATDEIELVAVADVDEETLEQFGEAWGIPSDRRYVGHEAMLDAEDLDVVSICTPSYLHHEHTIDAARSAADPDAIWCEKPIASQVSAAEEMIRVCEETDTELIVNHSFRFTTKLQRLRELVREENILGDVVSVSTQYRMELMRNSTHVLDTLVYLLDARAEQISGYVTGENEAVESLDVSQAVDDAGGGGHIVMDDGTFVTVDCTIPRDISSMTLQFIGTEGKLYMNNDDGEWRYWTLEDGDHVETDLPGIDGSWTWDDDYERSFANAARHVEDVLNGDAENISPGVEAARSLEIIVSFYLSHYTGGSIDVPLAEPLREVTITSW